MIYGKDVKLILQANFCSKEIFEFNYTFNP